MCGKSSGFTDFENTVDLGSAVIFDTDSGLGLSYVRTLGPKQNLDHRSFFSLGWYVNEFIQIISVFERSSYKLRWTVIGIVLCFSHQACCLLYIWARFTVAFTRISLPLNLNTSVFGCDCGFGFETNFGGSMDLAKKRNRDWWICIFTPVNTDTSPTQILHSVPTVWCPFLRGLTVVPFFHFINRLLTKGCLVIMAISLDIFTFMDLNSISAHKHTKTNLGPISSHLDHTLGH